jgi:hypothetical protein
MAGFANQLVSGLIGWKSMGGGINILATDEKTKKKYAKESADWNSTKLGAIRDEINRQYAEYSAKWKVDTLPADLVKKLGLVKITDADADDAGDDTVSNAND